MRFSAIVLALLALAQAPFTLGLSTGARWGSRVSNICTEYQSQVAAQQVCQDAKDALLAATLEYPHVFPPDSRRMTAVNGDAKQEHRRLKWWKKVIHALKKPTTIVSIITTVAAAAALPFLLPETLAVGGAMAAIDAGAAAEAGFGVQEALEAQLGNLLYRRQLSEVALSEASQTQFRDLLDSIDCSNTTVAATAKGYVGRVCDLLPLQAVPQAPVRIDPNYPFDEVRQGFRATFDECTLAAFYEGDRAFFYDKGGICTLADADPVEMSAAPELSGDIMYSPEAYLYTVHDPRNSNCLKECLTTARNMRKQWSGCGQGVKKTTCRKIKKAAYATATAQCALACST